MLFHRHYKGGVRTPKLESDCLGASPGAAITDCATVGLSNTTLPWSKFGIVIVEDCCLHKGYVSLRTVLGI